MHKIRRNLGWLLVSQLATWGVSIAVLVIAPRELGEDAFGRLSFVMVYVGLFELVALFGTGMYLPKAIARDVTALGRYVFNTLAIKLVVTSFLIFCAITLATIIGFERETVLLIGAYCVGLFFNALNSALTGGLLGTQQMRWPAVWDIARSYAGGAAGLLILLNGGSLLAFGLAFNVACGIPVVANLFKLLPDLRRHGAIDLRLCRTILVGGFPFFILSALVAFYGTVDIPLLEALTDTETVGWYALAYRWVSVPAFFAVSVSTAFFPALSAQGVTITRDFTDMANRALKLVAFVATPAAVGIALVADSFLTLLYNGEFQQAVPLIRLLALQIPVLGIDIVLASVVIAADRQRQWVTVSVAAAVFNPLANLVAIPISEQALGNGAIGAASVTILTEVMLLVAAVAMQPAGVLDRPTTLTLLRMVTASATMVPVVLVLGSTPLPVMIVAGAVTYGIASLALRTVSLDDVRGIRTRRVAGPAQAEQVAS
jgi:O-antigen/teichoic acid export membrane protein